MHIPLSLPSEMLRCSCGAPSIEYCRSLLEHRLIQGCSRASFAPRRSFGSFAVILLNRSFASWETSVVQYSKKGNVRRYRFCLMWKASELSTESRNTTYHLPIQRQGTQARMLYWLQSILPRTLHRTVHIHIA